jgi:hypothetical protein
VTLRLDLSDQSIDAIAEVITGGPSGVGAQPIGLYRTQYAIRDFFRPFGLAVSYDGQTRVNATRAVLHEARGKPDAGDLLKRIVERAADPRDFVREPERLPNVLDYLNRHLVFDGLKLEQQGHRVRLVPASQSASVVGEFAALVDEIDFDTVKRDLDRALASAEHDPEDAVTAACSVIESVCRSILIELGMGLPDQKDLASLYKAVREPLGLSPRKEVSDEIAADVRAILGGLNSTVQGIGALRTHAGDAHGRERGYHRIDPRIARLAIHSGSSVALFLVETWRKKFPERALKAR